MNASPTPLLERLERAENLVDSAAGQGAELLLLPELFNTGYAYSERNFEQAEPLDGITASWMRKMALQKKVHLAGSFLRRSGKDIYNTLLLVSPNGQNWIYDKHYPWMWERAYFRPGQGIQVAETALGRIGMLICWDVAHETLWRQYASRVDLMLVSSCPPAVHDLSLVLPDGQRIPNARLGPFMRKAGWNADQTFGALLRRQSAWLGVPVVQAAGTGLFRSPFPRPRLSMLTLALSCPPILKLIPHADQILFEAGYYDESYIAAASGEVLSRVPPGAEGFAISDVEIQAAPSQSPDSQPRFGLSATAYLLDAFAQFIFAASSKPIK
jgi:predicted amidohydrolase